MFITELSIKRPTISWVMSLILIVFGLFVFWKLPVRELPNGIQPPVVQIQVDYKSAAASIAGLIQDMKTSNRTPMKWLRSTKILRTTKSKFLWVHGAVIANANCLNS